MGGWDELQKAIGSGDFTDAAIAAALDSHQERFNSTLARAVMEVASLIKARLDANNIAAAHKFLHAKSPRGERARAIVREHAESVSTSYVLLVTPGDKEPELMMLNIKKHNRRTRELAIGVGAGWVLHTLMPAVCGGDAPEC